VWRTHFGESFSVGSGAASASIPEPSSTVVLLLSVVIVQCGRRPGRWQWHE
jgi:hypothetical protein